MFARELPNGNFVVCCALSGNPLRGRPRKNQPIPSFKSIHIIRGGETGSGYIAVNKILFPRGMIGRRVLIFVEEVKE
jgi:hypothetical protein